MANLQTEVLVIGGGATGTGVAWDAALRGFKVILVERRDLAHGTTGRYHGLLHSGGRYAVKDPQGAVECIAENHILRHTHAHCIEDTGGYFVVNPEDEGEYPDQFKAGCAATGIPCDEITPAAALRREPLLNRRISRVFAVPDASADSFLAAHSTVQAARQQGAQILSYHTVEKLFVAGAAGERRVIGAAVVDEVAGERFNIYADITVNAAGAWAGHIAQMAAIEVVILPAKGTMVAVNHRVVNTAINRCALPADGDIIVPAHTVAIIGTTSIKVSDPEHLRIEAWEVKQMLDEGDKLVPGFSRLRVLRAWAGVRPLFQESYGDGSGRDVSRQLTLLDHQQRDATAGFLTITGGKWTTFRLMAEATVDTICRQLATARPCHTATTPVPGADQGPYWLGHRLQEVESGRLQGELICECELVTRTMLENAARQNPTLTLDDLRRDVRLGMGPCQGGFCTYRAAGILHELSKGEVNAKAQRRGDAEETNAETQRRGGASETFAPLRPGAFAFNSEWQAAYLQSPAHNLAPAQGGASGAGRVASGDSFNPNLLLRDFLQERWRGLVPILWGRQLKQERLDELIYLSLMNVDHLPDGDLASPLTDFYHFDTTPRTKDTDTLDAGAGADA